MESLTAQKGTLEMLIPINNILNKQERNAMEDKKNFFKHLKPQAFGCAQTLNSQMQPPALLLQLWAEQYLQALITNISPGHSQVFETRVGQWGSVNGNQRVDVEWGGCAGQGWRLLFLLQGEVSAVRVPEHVRFPLLHTWPGTAAGQCQGHSRYFLRLSKS